MKAVGIRELKARLSAYLRDVAGGEIVLVTDRGRVVAELRAPADTPVRESDLDRRLREMASRVALSMREPHNPQAYHATGLHAPEGTAQGLLDADRSDA
jgi:antitoxin (DNA-binding transcriptional repressor) of toxin-antitoxin stability system